MLSTAAAWADGGVRLDYTNAGITAEKAVAALNDLQIELDQCITGLYNMRGGKEGDVPGPHAYQYQYNLEADNYAQYFVVTHKDFPYSNGILTSTYNVSAQFNGASHSGYNLAKTIFPGLFNNPKADAIPEIKAIYLLYFNLMALENSDLSGPFTYSEDKAGSQDPKTYESLRSIYYAIKADLDQIVACLSYYKDHRDADYKTAIENYLVGEEGDGLAMQYYNKYGTYDKIDELIPFAGDRMVDYIALANSLKLRMAIHMANIEPDTARQWAEEAVAAGVIETPDQQMGVFPSVSGFTHPLVEIANTWNDTRLSASFESLLMSLDHPYTKYFFKPNGNDIVNLGAVAATADLEGEVTDEGTRIVGIRSGSIVGEGQEVGTNPYIAYSTFDSDVIASAPLFFVKFAEVCFLRAEGALRGWNMGGTAQEFYEKGIRNAGLEDPVERNFTAEHAYIDYVDDYLKVATPIDYVQVDPQGLGADWPSKTKIGVTWSEADSRETKLEKIITQKYIALFPNSQEAWTELRRTGYPKLFAVLNTSEGDGSIKAGEMIRRIPWRITDPVQLGYVEATGIPALGGPDLQATRLWWDVDCDNFGAPAGISEVETAPARPAATYMLDGRKVQNASAPGLYIIDGRKVMR